MYALQGRLQDKRICVDLDGTAIDSKWPDLGDFKPGFVKAMKNLHEAGLEIIIFSCRLSPLWIDHETERDPWVVQEEIGKVRDLLDSAGLNFIRIWSKAGKPSCAVYVDDKAERYNDRRGSWDALTAKILARTGR